MRVRTFLAASVFFLPTYTRLAAQDPFEIVVYPAATSGRGEWKLETHLNYTARGTTAFDGTVAPSQKQTHLTFQLTHGITANWEASAYVLTAYRPGVGAQYAGWRLRSRVHAPARWNLPLDLGFSAELEAPQPAYRALPRRSSLRPFSRSGAACGWDSTPTSSATSARARRVAPGRGGSSPSALVAYRVSSVVTARLECHGAFGALKAPLAGPAQVHQLFPDVDLRLDHAMTLGLSVGAATTKVGNRLVFASRFEVEF